MKSCHVTGIIPARYASTRFPAKLLASIAGKSLLQRTYESAKKCQALDLLCIATDDERIAKHAKSFGAPVFMTSTSCQNGTERMIEAMNKYPELAKSDIYVNIQGDEPCIPASSIEKVIQVLKDHPKVGMSSAKMPIKTLDDLYNPAVVKCVTGINENALYFSRSCIPGSKDKNIQNDMLCNFYKHIGLYAFRKEFLLLYGTLPTTPLQKLEDLEMLKVLENGYSIKLIEVQETSLSVDIPEDIQKVEQWLCTRNLSL